jgi:hypothetical protein
LKEALKNKLIIFKKELLIMKNDFQAITSKQFPIPKAMKAGF